jgi:anthranilate synthase component 1
MYSPTPDEFLKLAAQGNVIPVTRRLLADIETPLSAYRKIRGAGESFLFESVEGGDTSGPLLVRRLQSARRHPADRPPRRSFGKRQKVIETFSIGKDVKDGLVVVERVMKKYRAVRCPACRASPAARSASSATNSSTTSSRSCRARRRTN